MKRRKTRGAFAISLALLGAATFLALPACKPASASQSQQAVTVVSLKVTGAKTEYFVGEKFSKEGMVVTAVKSDGSEEVVNDYRVSPSKALKIDDKSVTVIYGDVEFNLPITVRAVGVTGLELDVTSIELQVNGKKQITATVSPENATEKGCKYTSKNTAVATVSDAGLVSAVAVGETEITVETIGLGSDGKAISKTVKVSVKSTATTGLEIDVDDITLKKGETKQIGVTVLPTNATNKKVTFTSSNPSVASVSDAGLVSKRCTR